MQANLQKLMNLIVFNEEPKAILKKMQSITLLSDEIIWQIVLRFSF